MLVYYKSQYDIKFYNIVKKLIYLNIVVLLFNYHNNNKMSNHSRDTIVRRTQKELAEFKQTSDINENITAEPIKDDLFHWCAIMQGPKGSPYENGIFKLDIQLPSRYPYEAPRIYFQTKIYHPNISPSGQICLDILKDKSKWSPILTIKKTLLSISSLLTDPNPDDPLDSGAASLFKKDIEAYNKKVREYVFKYASDFE